MKEKIVGIDQGTTFCEVGFVGEDGRPKLIKGSSGQPMVKSAIWFKQNGDQVIGSQAARMKPIEPDRVYYQVKPEFDDPKTEFSIDGSPIKPASMAAHFYRHLKQQAEDQVGKIKKAVITVPAYFHDVGYEVMAKGAEKAGLEVVRVLREPASAAIGYALDEPLSQGEKVLVYDLGGGTFDVSVLEVLGEREGTPDIKVKRNKGDTKLGGRVFDQLILEELFIPHFKKEFGFDPTEDPQVQAKWEEEAEKLKKDLSQAKQATGFLQGKGESSAVSITRDQFRDLIQPKIDHTLGILEETLDQSNCSPSDIHRLVLVGGSTRIPAIRDQVSKLLGTQPESGVDPDQAVVIGASLVAADKGGETIRDKQGRRTVLLESNISDVTSHGLGVKAIDEDTGQAFNQVLVPAGKPLPASGQKSFRPTQDDATEILVTLLEGDDEDLNQCRILQEDYKLQISNPKSADLVKVDVKLVVNKDGLIEVRARNQDGDYMEESFNHPSISD